MLSYSTAVITNLHVMNLETVIVIHFYFSEDANISVILFLKTGLQH